MIYLYLFQDILGCDPDRSLPLLQCADTVSVLERLKQSFRHIDGKMAELFIVPRSWGRDMAQSVQARTFAELPSSVPDISRSLDHLEDPRVRAAVRLGAEARRSLGDSLRRRRFVEIPPVIVAPMTDPLNHPVSDPRIDYYGHSFQLTRSMIFHKQLALRAFDKVYCFSPNLRFEPLDRKDTGLHLVEFTQLDLEVKGATRDDMIALGESLVQRVVDDVGARCSEQLGELGRTLPELEAPFRQIPWATARTQHGPDFERILSRSLEQPFWITDVPLLEREFYDREDPSRPGVLMDMDLIYPEGYGEALSGGEREHAIGPILRRISAKGQTPEEFEWYIAAARHGLPPSAGFGIGIERLTRWLGGLPSCDLATLFPKRIGEWSL